MQCIFIYQAAYALPSNDSAAIGGIDDDLGIARGPCMSDSGQGSHMDLI
jgi:hypothetical protein